jgi:hypothetical protein
MRCEEEKASLATMEYGIHESTAIY